MSTLADTSAEGAGSLRRRFADARVRNPKARTRDLAGILSVSEAEVVAAGCIGHVRPLAPRWGELVKTLPALGRVMTLVRNEACVHEKVGQYAKVSVFSSMGLVLDSNIDLRIFFNHWHFGYAVTETLQQGDRKSVV